MAAAEAEAANSRSSLVEVGNPSVMANYQMLTSLQVANISRRTLDRSTLMETKLAIDLMEKKKKMKSPAKKNHLKKKQPTSPSLPVTSVAPPPKPRKKLLLPARRIPQHSPVTYLPALTRTRARTTCLRTQIIQRLHVTKPVLHLCPLKRLQKVSRI